MLITHPAILLALLSMAGSANAFVKVLWMETNDGNFVREDVPAIPQQVAR